MHRFSLRRTEIALAEPPVSADAAVTGVSRLQPPSASAAAHARRIIRCLITVAGPDVRMARTVTQLDRRADTRIHHAMP